MWLCKSTCARIGLLAAGLVLSLPACGYHLQGTGGSSLPPNIKKIHVPIFTNNTLEQGIEVRVTDSVRNALLNDGRVSLANEISDADAVLEGQILQYRLRAIAFSTADRAQEFRLRLTMKVSLRDLENNKVIFNQTIVSDREYRVTTELSSNEREQTQASQQASDAIARELQSLLIEGF